MFRTLDAKASNVVWTKFAGNPGHDLPNVQVSDLHYDKTTDVLIVGTYGRGAWVVKDASSVINTAPKLKIDGDDDPANPNDVIILKRDGNNPLLLDVYLGHDLHEDTDPKSSPAWQGPLAAFQDIDVYGLSGANTLIIDTSNGNIGVPGLIYFNGGGSGSVATARGDPGMVIKEIPGSTDTRQLQSLGTTVKVQCINSSPLLPLSPLTSDEARFTAARDSLQEAVASSWSSHLADGSLGGEDLAALGTTLGDVLNGANFTETLPISDPIGEGETEGGSGSSGIPLLRRIVESGTGAFNIADVTSLDDLRDKLDALDDVPGNVSYTSDANGVRFDMQVKKTLSGEAHLDVYAVGGAVNLTGALDLSADVSVHLVFGVDANGFFIDAATNPDPELVVRNVQVTGQVSGEGQIGFLGVTLSAGTISMDPGVTLTVKLHAPSTESNGLIRLEDLSDDIGSLASAKLTGTGTGHDLVLTGTFGVAALAPGLDAPFDLGSAQVSLTWANITDPTNVQFSADAAPGQDLLHFLNVSAGQYISGLTDLAGQFQAISGVDVLGTKIPVVNKSLGDILNGVTQALNIQGDKVSGVSEVSQEGDFNKFAVSLAEVNSFSKGISVGDTVTYQGANGETFQGIIDSVDVDQFVVRAGVQRVDPQHGLVERRLAVRPVGQLRPPEPAFLVVVVQRQEFVEGGGGGLRPLIGGRVRPQPLLL